MTEILRIAYRDHDRTPLLYLIKEQAVRYEDLDIKILHVPGESDYRNGFLNGAFELVCEQLRFLFPARLAGHPVRCLAATQNHAVERLVSARPIRSAEEMKGMTAAVRDNESSRLTLRYWLKNMGMAHHVMVKVYPDKQVGRWQQWQKVACGEADIALCSPLYLKEPLEAGLHVAEIPPLPVIGPLYFATRAPVIHERDNALERFIRALYRAVHVFRNDPEETISVMKRGPAELMKLNDDEAITRQYEMLRENVAEPPIPLLESMQNTFEMVQEAYDIKALNPLTLWDLRYVLALEERHLRTSDPLRH